MSAPIGARQDGCFKAVSMAPSFNLTPVGPAMPPLPYPTVSDLSNSIGVARSVRFNGKPVYTMASSQPDCKGDEQGSGGGVRSGTVNGEVKPTSASGTVKVEGKRVVRDGDTCTMNGGNNTGIYMTVPAPSPAPPVMAATTSNPPVKPETLQEKSSLRRWLDELRQEVQQAAAQPLEGLKGAVKGVINIPSNTVELLAKAAVEQHAAELSDAAITASALGQAGTAKSLTELVGASREQAVRIDVPKMHMSNQAQQGGDVIAAAVGVFAGGVGLAKAGTKTLAKMCKVDSVTDASILQNTTLTETTLKNQGVKITRDKAIFRSSKLMSREEIATWLRENHQIYDESKLEDMLSSFDPNKPVKLIELQPGQEVIQYVRENGRIGTFFAYPGATAESLAISSEGRVLTRFSVTKSTEVLEGTAAEFPVGKYPGVGGPGGGIQLIPPKGNLNFSILK